MPAGVKRYVLRRDKDGNPRMVLSCERMPYKAGETLPSMEERVRKDLYQMEQEQGSSFNGIGEFSTKMLRKVWVENVERDAAFDRAREEAFRRTA